MTQTIIFVTQRRLKVSEKIYITRQKNLRQTYTPEYYFYLIAAREKSPDWKMNGQRQYRTKPIYPYLPTTP